MAKVLEFQPQHQSFQWIFGTDFLYDRLVAVQGTLKSLLQYQNSKALILRCSAFFIVQLSHPYMATGKTIALTRQTFVGKVMSLFFNILSRLFIAFLSGSKCLLISWLQSPSAVIFGAQESKVYHCFHCFPIYLPRNGGTRYHDLNFLNVEFQASFSLSSFTLIKRLLVPLHFLPLEWYNLHIWSCWYFSWSSCFQLVIHPARHFMGWQYTDLLYSFFQFWTSQLFHFQF